MEKLGATGRFPQGKANKRDEGEIQFAVGIKDGVVVMDFGKPVAWIGFDPEAARNVATLLKKHADSLEQ